MDKKKFEKEYKRFKDALSSVGESELILLEPLICQAAQLKISIDEDFAYVTKHGRFQYSTKGNVRESFQSKTLEKNTILYSNVIKSIEKIVTKDSAPPKNNEVMDFINNAKEKLNHGI